MTRRACRQCLIKRDEEKFTGPRGHLCSLCRKKNTRASARERHLRATYEITPLEYELLAANGCNACGGARPYAMNVDHDHAIAERYGMRASVRGTLCRRCNKALRDCRDDIGLLEKLAAYLRNPPAKSVLFP